jgi:hypothetical protein
VSETPHTAAPTPTCADSIRTKNSPRDHRMGWLVSIAWLLASVCVVRGVLASRGERLLRALPNGVNPNVAPWWELTVLPDVGPAIARRIVAYRESRGPQATSHSPAYNAPSDLDAVSGIGPKTLQSIAPYLRFDDHSSPHPRAPR